MKIGKFKTNENNILWGIIDGERVMELSERRDKPSEKEILHNINELTIMAPASPSKILAIGKNYKEHAKEMGSEAPESPILFLKAPSSLISPGEEIKIPSISSRVDYEAELAVVVGRHCRNLKHDEAIDVVWGFTCLNDVTARDLQKKDGQWGRAKSFDTFCPLGPWLETELNWEDTQIELILNGETKQKASTNQMIFSVVDLLVFISSVMTLNPGDVIATGTPAGVGPIKPGDEVTVKIEGIGELTNPVVADK